MKKILRYIVTAVVTTMLMATIASAAYKDVPAESPLAGEVQKAAEYGLMNGYNESTFGYLDSMTRAQFTAVLVRMMGWEMVTPDTASYADVPVGHTWFDEIETAATHDVTGTWVNFRPQEPITRGEMAEMLVRALGLKSAAESLNSSQMPFSDAYSILHGQLPFTDLAYRNEGYVAVAYAIGMTNGTSATTFSPERTATRGQAAAMLVRIYENLYQKTDEVHGFYAISSYNQLSLADEMDTVSAGWSRMMWDGETALLSTTSANGNEYYVPNGYGEVAERLDGKLHLSVFMEGESVKSLLASEAGRSQAVEQIIYELTVNYRAIGKNPYAGVTIDFEGLRGAQKQDFINFLSALKLELDEIGKKLYVCVSPVLSTGYYGANYYDGYDYAAIGKLADKVILMAYDYEAKDMSQFVGTNYYYKIVPSTPINEVYLGIRAITAQMDPSKVLLGFSCRSVGWQIDKEGKLVSGAPVYPTTETVAKRLAQTDTELGWSDEYQQHYAIYQTEDGSRYFLWYQDDASIQVSMNAAKLLGVTGASVWRLGTIPQGDWNWNLAQSR
ncbi:MAG: glycoside hydrolase [Ruminococcaceae bacterium]|nr:glycoside hydrolase [Oscillospiraceae bacterium]